MQESEPVVLSKRTMKLSFVYMDKFLKTDFRSFISTFFGLKIWLYLE